MKRSGHFLVGILVALIVALIVVLVARITDRLPPRWSDRSLAFLIPMIAATLFLNLGTLIKRKTRRKRGRVHSDLGFEEYEGLCWWVSTALTAREAKRMSPALIAEEIDVSSKIFCRACQTEVGSLWVKPSVAAADEQSGAHTLGDTLLYAECPHCHRGYPLRMRERTPWIDAEGAIRERYRLRLENTRMRRRFIASLD